MTDTDRYFAAWVELDRIHASDMTDAEKNTAIEAVIQSHNMDALWHNVDKDKFHAMTQQYEQAKSIRKQSPEWFQQAVSDVPTSTLLAEAEHIREMNALWERINQRWDRIKQKFIIKKRLEVLVGLPVAGFMRSYGDELTLHLGELRPYSSERMKHLQRGSYIISTRASRCRLAPYDHPDSSTSHTVKSVSVETGGDGCTGFVLTIEFSDTSTFTITPSRDSLPELADWEVLFPDGTLLRVGPGGKVTTLPAT